MTLVDHEHFNPGDVSVAAQISKIHASNAQVLLVGTAGTPAGIVFHGITDAGLNLPVVTGNGNASQAFMKQYASILPKELYVESTHCLAPSAIADRAEKAAYDAYTAAMAARGVAVDCLQALAWDPALILTTALRHVGTNASAEAAAGVSREREDRRRQRHLRFQARPATRPRRTQRRHDSLGRSAEHLDPRQQTGRRSARQVAWPACARERR